MLFPGKKGKNQSQQQADKNRSSQRKVEREVVTFDVDVAWQPAESSQRSWGGEGQQQTDGQKDDTESDEELCKLGNHRTPGCSQQNAASDEDSWRPSDAREARGPHQTEHPQLALHAPMEGGGYLTVSVLQRC